MTTQPHLPTLAPPVPEIHGTVQRVSPNLWQARIWHGWYVALGTTKAAAMAKVTKLYNDEMNK